MIALPLFLQTAIFCYMLWLGLYLLSRNLHTPLMIFSAAGTLTFALMLASDLIYQSGIRPELLVRLSWSLPLLLSVFWVLAILALLPADLSLRRFYPLLLGVYGILYLITTLLPLVFDYSAAVPTPAIG